MTKIISKRESHKEANVIATAQAPIRENLSRRERECLLPWLWKGALSGRPEISQPVSWRSIRDLAHSESLSCSPP
ncbi:hypothetical protein EUGRSUZ_C02770 [Eucalyptus grandis]|uniref:Uncharacterized protein n=2 Tax=Eucalyptus grandis TaxID=71139 RepID=A0ACC3LGL5_EUCGR|nr:hypothetical protein EUGRSUZ_C02770 [Eucalyptus grandis]